MSPDPAEYGWWLASRAAGVIALVCVAISVALGLAMAGRVSARPGLARALLALHRQTALAGLVAIAVHGITLLGDRHLDPGLAGIAVPFVIDHAPLWTGLGVTAGWLAAILGLSYWIRDRIGPARWRALHRATILVYVLAVAHTLGAGTDAETPWMRTLLIVTGAPVLFLFVMRVLPAPSRGPSFRRFRIGAITPESADVTSFAARAARRPATGARGARPVRLGAAGRSRRRAPRPELLAHGRGADQRQTGGDRQHASARGRRRGRRGGGGAGRGLHARRDPATRPSFC